MSHCESVVDVSAESVERSTSFLEHFVACHFCSADASADEHLDALCTYAHSVGHCHLDGPPVGYTAFDLAGDAVCHDVGVYLRTLNFEDVDLYVLAGYLLELFLKLLDLSSLLADDEARSCCINCHGDELESPLDHNPAEAGLCKTVAEILADLIILRDLLCIVTTTPVRVPTTGDTDSVADRICFLSHIIYSPLVVLHRG